MVDIKELNEAKENAVMIMVTYAKSERTALSREEIASVEKCMELADCNKGNCAEAKIQRRKIEATSILRDCIMPTNRKQLKKIETAIMEIVPQYCESGKTK